MAKKYTEKQMNEVIKELKEAEERMELEVKNAEPPIKVKVKKSK